MKEDFAGYYRPTKTELSRLWGNCIFVLDASVLLNLYRFPQEARDDLLKILRNVSGRSWLPYQAALEYQENRLNVIVDQVAKYEDVREILQKCKGHLVGQLNQLQLKKRHSRINPDHFLAQLRPVFDEFLVELEQLEQEQPGVFQEDPIRQQIDELFEGKIGSPPESQEALDTLYQEGGARYEAMRPPGYKDAEKEGHYLYAGLTYQTRYGDWILWHQIISEANNNDKFKYIIFVTDDDKKDWWWVVDSKGKKTIGPRPELVAEIYAKAPVSQFYMYNSQRFMQFAADYLGIDVREESIRQVHDIIELDRYRIYSEDETGFIEFLQTLIDIGDVEEESLSVTEKVIETGIESLDDRQMRIFKENVLDVLTVERCSRCGIEIPWSEMYEALDNGNLCSYCWHMWEKMKKE